MAHFDNSHRRSKQQFDNNFQNPDVSFRHSGISGENNVNGQVKHEAFPVVPENSLEISPIIGQKDSMFRDFEQASDLVERPPKCVDRLSFPCRGIQSPVIYRCICQGLGCTFRRPDSGMWLDTEANLHINILELKGVFLPIRSFQTHLVTKRVLVASDNATVVSYLNKQGGTHSLEVCLMIWHLMTFCNPRAILLRAQHIQSYLNVIPYSLSHRDKIIQTEWSLHPKIFQMICQIWHRPMVDLFATKMNKKLPLYVSPVPDPNGSRCIEYIMGDTRWLCLLSNSSHSKADSKNENLCLPNDCSSPRVARDELVLGPDRSFHKTSTTTSTLGNNHSVKGFIKIYNIWIRDQNHLKNSQSQWHRELRHLKDFHSEGSMNQGGPFFNHAAKRIRWISSNLLSP